MAESGTRPSIHRTLLALLLGATAITWLVTGVVSYVGARHETHELLDAHLAQSAALLVTQIDHEFEEIQFEDAPQLHKYGQRAAFQIWEGGTVPRLHSASAPDGRLSSREDGFSDSDLEGRHWRVFSAWDPDHRFLVQVGEEQHAREEISASIAKNLLMPLLAALPILGVLIWLAATRAMRPLVTLGDQVSAQAPENLAPIVLPDAPVELVPLVSRLNALFSCVSASLESERRFTADAAHELRTPIAALKAQAQVALAATESGERERALGNIVVGCNRASHLVDQMLTLARVDPGLVGTHPDRCDLRAVARSALAEIAPMALEKQVDVELQPGPAGWVGAAPALAEALLRNLIDNAVRYSPAGTTARVAVDSDAGRVLLKVTDEGPGVPDSEFGRLGERFHRLSGTIATGSGLGLSIVRRIAETTNASVAFSHGPGGKGLLVTVSFPRAK